jgi:hypothetical protein
MFQSIVFKLQFFILIQILLKVYVTWHNHANLLVPILPGYLVHTDFCYMFLIFTCSWTIPEPQIAQSVYRLTAGWMYKELGSNSQQEEVISFFCISSRLALGVAQTLIHWVPDDPVKPWRWPITYIYCQGYEFVDIYLSILINSLIEPMEKLYLQFLLIINSSCIVSKKECYIYLQPKFRK